MRRYLPFIIVVAVGLLTLGSGTLFYRAKRAPILTISKHQVAPGKDGAGHVRGQADAPVTLEEFADFQCPPCGMLSGVINQFEKEYHPRLRIIFRHFPLTSHQHARAASLAAEAAGLQGKFWEMHDILYKQQASWSKAADVKPLFNAYAGILGLNHERFNQDMESEKVKARVTADQQYGASLGVQNTPTIFINNRAVPPNALNPSALRAAIDAALNPKPATQ